jgi:hypothetical protein
MFRVAVDWLYAVGLIGAGLTVLIWLVPAAPLTGDGAGYVEFVRNNLQHGASSWHERRLLGPLIVRALPLDAVPGFFILTVTSLAITALLTWRAATDLIGSSTRALVAVPLLLGTWVVAPNLREYALIDPLAWAFVAAMWLCTVRRQWLIVAALGALGVLAKEVVCLAALAAAAAAWQRQRPWPMVLVAAPALVVVVVLTVMLPGSGGDISAYVLKWVRDGLGSLGPTRVLYLAFASYGALWLLVPAGVLGMPAYLRRAALVFLLAGLLLPLVGSPERMEEAIFPAIVATAVLATCDWPQALVWTLALGNALFVARVGGDARIPTAVAWIGLAIALGLVGWRWLAPRIGSTPGRVGARPATPPS